MKKLLITNLIAVTLAACSSGISKEKPIEAGHNIQNLCLKGSFRAAPENFSSALTTSLKHKNITILKRVENDYEGCDYLMSFRAKGNNLILAMARINVIDLANGRPTIGSVSYNRRGEERTRSNEVGLQGQTDLIINTLFKNY